VRAALRDQRRKQAIERRQKLLEGEPGSLVTAEERQQLLARCEGMFKNVPRMPGREKERQAWAVFENAIRQIEAQRKEEKKLVKPPEQGLIVPRNSLLITLDEARQAQMR